jgi:hypothetical protein
MTIKTIPEYARHLAETFGSQLSVAERQTSCTSLIVNTCTGEATLVETIHDDYQTNDAACIQVIETRHMSASGGCDACEEDDEFAAWLADATYWDVDALAEEIADRLVRTGVTDTSVEAWGVQG